MTCSDTLHQVERVASKQREKELLWKHKAVTIMIGPKDQRERVIPISVPSLNPTFAGVGLRSGLSGSYCVVHSVSL